MKKQYFISIFITCAVIFNVKAQNTPIDDFLRRYTNKEGLTTITVSQQMLQSIFAHSNTASEIPIIYTLRGSNNDSLSISQIPRISFTTVPTMNVPEAYSSLSISRKEDSSTNFFLIFINVLNLSKYEKIMEVNQENKNVLGYYMMKVNDKCNEIVVLRQQDDLFSAIYIKGDININQIENYLTRIRSALTRMGAYNTDISQSNNQFAFDISSSYSELAQRLRMEEEAQNSLLLRDYMQRIERQRRFNDAIENARDRTE